MPDGIDHISTVGSDSICLMALGVHAADHMNIARDERVHSGNRVGDAERFDLIQVDLTFEVIVVAHAQGAQPRG